LRREEKPQTDNAKRNEQGQNGNEPHT
jgi:hypothetical protein